ncbi:cupin-like domain-containing protein [Hyalangium versicolor]|uniref:cupin-like domain-containing protein n=1 Tax=Hyalangium versicolor TaxID=2861190 RepID=UPI001CC9BE88|nr:cupin-like domain-containing protein [Hyalangium versicolor]
MSIERLQRPSREEFEKHYLRTGTPVVITGAMDEWPAMKRWTNEYLRSRAGERSIRVSTAHRGVHFKGGDKIIDYSSMKLGDYIDLVTGQQVSDGRLYATVVPIQRALPELWEDVSFPPYFNREECPSPNMWFGPGNNVSPLHYDSTHNILTQVRGSKRVTLYPPREIGRLYPFAFSSHSMHISQVNMVEPDHSRFPEFQKAERLEFVLEQGEMLFIPLFWWHALAGIGENISINYWWRTPMVDYLRHPRQTSRGLGGLVVNSARSLLRLRQAKPQPERNPS